MIACLASQPSFPAYTDGGSECWLVSWLTSHVSEAPCQPCKSFYFFISTNLCHPHFLRKSQLSFYKKPSVEKYFLTLIRQSQKRQHSLADIPYTASKKTGDEGWKVSFDPLLYNAVTYQANANNMSPSDYIRQIQNNIDSAYNPLVVRDENAKEIETMLRAEFKNKPTVQQVFMYLMLSAEKEANAGRV